MNKEKGDFFAAIKSIESRIIKNIEDNFLSNNPELHFKIIGLLDQTSQEVKKTIDGIMGLYQKRYSPDQYQEYLNGMEKIIYASIENNLKVYFILRGNKPIMSMYSHDIGEKDIYLGGLYKDSSSPCELRLFDFFKIISSEYNTVSDLYLEVNYSACGIKNEIFDQLIYLFERYGFTIVRSEENSFNEYRIMKKLSDSIPD